MVKSANSKLFLCILLFCKFLMYFIVFILMYFFVLWFFIFCNLILINFKIYKIVQNGQKDKINIVLEHFKKISNFHVFCTQTYAKCRFWAIFEPTCEYKKSRDLATDGPISQTWYQKICVRLERKKVMKSVSRSAAVATQSWDFVQGDTNWTPTPPPQLR